MSQTLLAIMAHSGAEEACHRHWPLWKASGCDIAAIGRQNSQFPFPPGAKINVRSGLESPAKGDNHLVRFLDVLEGFLSGSRYDDCCVIEYDCLVLKPIPPHPGGLCCYAFDNEPGSPFFGKRYFHCPWWTDRYCARLIVDRGRKMLQSGLLQGGFLDRWLGLMVDLYPEINVTPAPAYSRNSLDTPQYMAEAREAVKKGVVFVHGVKTAGQLEELTSNL